MHHAFFISLWASVAFTLYFIEFTRLPERIKIGEYQPLNRKPFNCEACLPFWAFAAFWLLAIYVCPYIPAFIAGGCTAGIITSLLLKRITK